MTKKEITKTTEQAVAPTIATPSHLEAWGTQEISAKDLMIPKILPMQGMSKLVLNRKAQLGEFRDSLSGELLGSIDTPLEIIPFHVERLWVINEKINGKWEYARTEAVTPSNEGRAWEEGNFRYTWTYSFYVLIASKVAEGIPFPYVINFRSTSVKGGKKLFNRMFVYNRQLNKAPNCEAFMLSGKLDTNDKGTYVVLDVYPSRPSNEVEQRESFNMFKMIKAGKAKVDHSEDAQVTSTPNNHASENVEF